MLADDERRKLNEKYPNLDIPQYQPPDTLLIASREMNKHQSKQDMSLRRLRYLLSGDFPPLDILGLEISTDIDNASVQRFLYMLRDCRSLLLNVSAQVTKVRNTIAFQAMNTTFTSTSSSASAKFTMSPEVFQAALVQQTTTAQVLRNAGNQRTKNVFF